MKEKFKEYLLERYKPGSVNSYISGLNHLSRDYGSDIFKITDSRSLREIRKQYDLNGSKRSVGDYGNGSARNAIIQYCNFIESNDKVEDFATKESIECKSESTIESRRFTYERDLHNTLLSQVGELFPEYNFVGSEYSIDNVRLDLLLEKGKDLLIVELKAGTATYEVFGQISMYMGLIKDKFKDHNVQGVIIASEIHKGLKAACSTSNLISCMKYNLKLSIESV